ncbi:hypothetical protein MM213_06165 [Belliella sp. R4-6]|uniref:Uncharacterized protein n=1 Tax=Belliella alkalica TaxID=1730871 RepID=A0ABS9V9H2_9BACT|nr:DUF2683 family protein [Belliella alkalica]MCH7413058.1 hypothetical protein [Belliella alkalica]
MEKIVVQTKDKSKLDLVKSMLEAMRIDFKVVTDHVLNENPSPSGDPYFDNPKNIENILEGVKQLQSGEVVKLSKDKRKKMLGL